MGWVQRSVSSGLDGKGMPAGVQEVTGRLSFQVIGAILFYCATVLLLGEILTLTHYPSLPFGAREFTGGPLANADYEKCARAQSDARRRDHSITFNQCAWSGEEASQGCLHFWQLATIRLAILRGRRND